MKSSVTFNSSTHVQKIPNPNSTNLCLIPKLPCSPTPLLSNNNLTNSYHILTLRAKSSTKLSNNLVLFLKTMLLDSVSKKPYKSNIAKIHWSLTIKLWTLCRSNPKTTVMTTPSVKNIWNKLQIAPKICSRNPSGPSLPKRIIFLRGMSKTMEWKMIFTPQLSSRFELSDDN